MDHRVWILSIADRNTRGKKYEKEIQGYFLDTNSAVSYLREQLLAEREMDIESSYEDWLTDHRYRERDHPIEEFREELEETLDHSLNYLRENMNRQYEREGIRELYEDGGMFTYIFTLAPFIL